MCQNCQNGAKFDKVIAKIKWCSFLTHCVLCITLVDLFHLMCLSSRYVFLQAVSKIKSASYKMLAQNFFTRDGVTAS